MGMCLYNGHETKIMLNGGQSKQKRSDLEKILNTYFKYICIFQVVATLISAIIYGLIVSLNYENLAYINESPYFLEDTIFTWGSWFISFSNFIPISLLVTVEMVRYGQGYLLSKD
jgi:phospholipid-transporting ATPase